MESRRSFIKKTAVAGSAVIVAPTIIPAKAFGANDRINAAVLGLNGRGKSHVKGLMVQDIRMELAGTKFIFLEKYVLWQIPLMP